MAVVMVLSAPGLACGWHRPMTLETDPAKMSPVLSAADLIETVVSECFDDLWLEEIEVLKDAVAALDAYALRSGIAKIAKCPGRVVRADLADPKGADVG